MMSAILSTLRSSYFVGRPIRKYIWTRIRNEINFVMDLQLENLQTLLTKVHDFVELYLPFANAHASNFITEDHWNIHLIEDIQDELLSLSYSELQTLPCHAMQSSQVDSPQSGSELEIKQSSNNNTHIPVNRIQTITLDCPDKQYGPHNEQPCNQGKQKDTMDECEPQHCQKNQRHRNITQFCQNAFNNTVEGCGEAVSVEKLMTLLGASKMKDGFIGDFMNLKKGHEVDVMSEVCAMLVKETNCQLVIDFGSGKGYLGNNLALQYSIPVLGIDAMSSYTQSAEKRMTLLGKQWDGLALKAVLGEQKFTKREKKKVKVEVGSSQTDVMSVSKEESEKFSEGKQKTEDDGRCNSKDTGISRKYVPVTEFVSQTTDFMRLAIENFPDLFSRTSGDRNVGNIAYGQNTLHSEFSSMEETKCSKTDKELIFDNPASDSSLDKKVNGASSSTKSIECSRPDMNIRTENLCNLMLTGLHTCGNLASTSLYLFVNNSTLKTVCSVGCCYNLLDEEFMPGSKEERKDTAGFCGFPMSQFLKEKKVSLGATARNLASQSIHRISSKEEVLQGERFFQRALLEKIVQDICGKEGVTWKGLRNLVKKCSSTKEYIRKALEKLSISHLIADETIESYVERYTDYKQKLTAAFQLRAVLAPCIESFILLDRVCYLLEQECIKKVYLVKLFDPIVSPRCYGIVAFKH